MSKQTDTLENAIIKGNLSVITNDNPGDLGPGNIECSGIVYTDNIIENTSGLGVDIEGINLNDNHYTMTNISQPSNPNISQHKFYTNNDLLKSINTSGIVKVYNPNNSKGDIITHNGITDVTLPVGNINQVLTVIPESSNGIIWKDISNDTGIINTTVSKIFDVYNSNILNYSSSYSDIQFDTERVKDDFYEHLTNSQQEIKFLSSGTFLIYTRITTQGNLNNGTGSSVSRIMEDTGSGYTEVPGTISGNINIGENSGTSMVNFYIKDYNIDDKIKIQISKFNGTNSVQVMSNGCEFMILRIKLDNLDDISKYLDTYTTSNTILTNTFSNIPFNTNRYIDSIYSHTSGSSDITINQSGIYVIKCKITTDKTSGIDESQSEFNLTKNGAIIPGTYTATHGSDTTSRYSTGCIYIIDTFTIGDIIRLSGRINFGSNMSTLANGTNICIESFQSSSNAQDTAKFFSGYDLTGGTVINSSFTDIPLSNETITNSIYTHSANSPEVTVNETGRYFIFGRVTINNITTGNNKQTTSQLRLVLNSGGGFTEINGSISRGYHYSSDTGIYSLYFGLTLNLGETFILKLQAAKIAGVGDLQSVPNGSSLSILKLSNPITLENSLLKFGTYYKSAISNNTTQTTSITFIEKLRLTTDIIPSGTYIILFTYRWIPSSPSRTYEGRVQVDDTVTIHQSLETSSDSLQTQVVTSYSIIDLELGIHNVDLDFRSADNSQATIDNSKISIWRVT